jgi:serine/threonine-protein kinase
MSYRRLFQGDRIGEYELQERLGENHWEEVWKAGTTSSPNQVVIKLPASEDLVEPLKKNADFHNQHNHRHIVRTIGYNLEHDPPYFVSEYVLGRNLKQFIKGEGILPPRKALDIAIQVLDVLAFLEGKGVTSPNLTPENILIEKRGQDNSKGGTYFVHMTDLVSELPPVSLTEIFYRAPEQRLTSKNIDIRANIYTVGVLLYEMLTGELPSGMEYPSERNPALDPVLDRIVKKAMLTDREARYSNPKEMAIKLVKVHRYLLRPRKVKKRGLLDSLKGLIQLGARSKRRIT